MEFLQIKYFKVIAEREIFLKYGNEILTSLKNTKPEPDE